MKAKLIKTEVNYILEDDKGVVIASTSLKKEGLELSLKNCQAIERGYDLDELVEGFIERTGYHDFDSYSYKLGFQKALELLGDKKFSEVDVANAIHKYYLMIVDEDRKNLEIAEKYKLIKSLQQTEWDVFIQIDNVLSFEANQENARVNPNYGKFRLDADGFLILKRI